MELVGRSAPAGLYNMPASPKAALRVRLISLQNTRSFRSYPHMGVNWQQKTKKVENQRHSVIQRHACQTLSFAVGRK
jgi:hypothetical protein